MNGGSASDETPSFSLLRTAFSLPVRAIPDEVAADPATGSDRAGRWRLVNPILRIAVMVVPPDRLNPPDDLEEVLQHAFRFGVDHHEILGLPRWDTLPKLSQLLGRPSFLGRHWTASAWCFTKRSQFPNRRIRGIGSASTGARAASDQRPALALARGDRPARRGTGATRAASDPIASLPDPSARRFAHRPRCARHVDPGRRRELPKRHPRRRCELSVRLRPGRPPVRWASRQTERGEAPRVVVQSARREKATHRRVPQDRYPLLHAADAGRADGLGAGRRRRGEGLSSSGPNGQNRARQTRSRSGKHCTLARFGWKREPRGENRRAFAKRRSGAAVVAIGSLVHFPARSSDEVCQGFDGKRYAWPSSVARTVVFHHAPTKQTSR